MVSKFSVAFFVSYLKKKKKRLWYNADDKNMMSLGEHMLIFTDSAGSPLYM